MKVDLIHNKTGEAITGEQYLQGQRPTPNGVKVTLGLQGVLARVNTAAGDMQVMNSTDWLLDLPPHGQEIFTDTFVRSTYTVKASDAPSEPDKPLKIG